MPVGEAKGFGLALLSDLMCGLPMGGAMADELTSVIGTPEDPAECSLRFHPTVLGRSRTFARAKAYVRRIEASRRRPGQGPAHVPGRGRPQRIAKTNGTIRIAARTLADLHATAEALGLPDETWI